MAHYSRIQSDTPLKRAWTKPVIEELSAGDALLKLMKAKHVPAPMIEEIQRRSRSVPHAD